MADISTNLLIKIAAQNAATGAIAGLQKDLNGLKGTVLQVGAALAGAFAVKSIIDTTEQWGEAVKALQAETGLSAESASRLNFVAQALGVSSDELNTSLGKLAKNLFSNSVEADKGKDAFSKWGIATHDADGHLRNVNDVLVDTAARVKQLGDSAASRALEMDLFGKAGGRMHELLLQGAEGVQALANESDALGLTLNQTTVGAIHQAAIEGRVFGLALDGLKVALGVQLLPLLSNIVREVTKFIGELSHATTGSRVMAGMVKTLGEAFRVLWGLGKSVVDFLHTLHGWFVSILGPLGATRVEADLLVIALAGIAGGPVLASAAAVGLAYGEVKETVGLIARNWEAVRTAAHTAALENQNDGNDFGRATLRALVWWGDAFNALGKNTRAKFEEWGAFFSSFGTVVKSVFDTLGLGFRQIFDTIGSLIQSKLDGLGDIINNLIKLANSIPGVHISTGGGNGAGGNDTRNREGGQSGHSAEDRLATLDDIYAAFTRNHGVMPDMEYALSVLHRVPPPWWSDVQGLATGGIVTRPTFAMIGERGPEAVIPLSRGGGMGNTINVYVTGNIAENERDLADRIGQVMLRELGHLRNMAYS